MTQLSIIVSMVFICLINIRRQQTTAMHLIRKLRRLRRHRWIYHLSNKVDLRPGRGFSLAGFKASYRTNRLTNRYHQLRSDATWFNVVVHMSSSDFTALHELAQHEINIPLDPYNKLSRTQRAQMRRKRKKLTSQELLFLYLEMLSGGICGADAIVNMVGKYGVCNGTVWNYVYHTGWACFRALSSRIPITWPDEEERLAMQGLITGFPEAIMFVDGTRQPVFKSIDEDTQNDQYFGKDRRHCYAVLIYVDIYGFIRRVEISYSGRLHDKTMFQMSDVFLIRGNYFSPNEKMICDAGFVGAGDRDWRIVPIKKGTGLFFELRKEWNKDVRQRFRNEMAIGYMKNRNRAFMGCWPYADELFTASIKVAAMIMNWKLYRNGREIVPIDRMIRRMSGTERVQFMQA